MYVHRQKSCPKMFLLMLALFTVAIAGGEARAQTCYVTRNGADFSFKGGTYKFIGVNLRGLVFHSDGEIDTQLASARDMGVTVVRVFIAKNNLNVTQVGDELANFLTRMTTVAPNMKVLIALTDFYGATYYPDGSRLGVQGDDGYYVNGTLAPSWFTGGYNTNYKPFVTTLVTRFKDDERIFAWELGNELKAGTPTDMLNFAYTMGWEIRNTGARQMVSTGFIGAWHAFNGNVNNTLLGQLYAGPWGSWSSSPFHFGSIHTYNNEQAPGNPFGYQYQDWDINWFINNGFPYIVGEGGFTGASSCTPAFTGSTWDGVSIPSGQSDRGGPVSATINRYFDVKGADGYMQWGFLQGGDNGEGDACSGMDSHWHSDWTSLRNTYSAKASVLPSGGASCSSTCTASVPAGSWTGHYYNNLTLSGSPVMTRDDGTGALNFNWGTGSPGAACGVPVDNFSARWTRTVYFSAGTYRFSTTADDGVRLYVDGVLRIDKWFDQAPTTYTVDLTLSAGNHTLRMDYYERGGGAVATLTWGSAGMNGSTPGGTNLALGATCNSDSVYGTGWDCTRARDGVTDGGSKWTSTGTSSTHWLTYDLGSYRIVNGYIVRHAGAGGEPTYFNTQQFQIQTADSLSGPWTDDTVVDNGAQANVTTRSYSVPKVVRFIRLYITDAGIDTYARIPEFEVRGP